MNTRLVNCPLFDHPVPIAAALMAVASQENHDGPEDDLMVSAAEYIRVLESLVDFFNINYDPYDLSVNSDEWIERQDDPGIARQAIDLFNEPKDAQAHNEVLSDTAHQQPECTQCGDTGRSYPTLENPDGVVCDCMLNKE